jgi:hypothetical protein
MKFFNRRRCINRRSIHQTIQNSTGETLFMKTKMIWSVIGIVVFAFGIVAWAQTEQPAATPQNAQQNQLLVLQDLAGKLDQMVQNLEQGNVTPETLKDVTAQMKQMSQMLKLMAGVTDPKVAKHPCCQVRADQSKSDTK